MCKYTQRSLPENRAVQHQNNGGTQAKLCCTTCMDCVAHILTYTQTHARIFRCSYHFVEQVKKSAVQHIHHDKAPATLPQSQPLYGEEVVRQISNCFVSEDINRPFFSLKNCALAGNLFCAFLAHHYPDVQNMLSLVEVHIVGVGPSF